MTVLFAFGAVALPLQQHLRLDASSAVAFAAVAVIALLVTRRRPALGIALLLVLDPFDLSRYVTLTTLTLPKAALVGALAGLALRRPSLSVLGAARSRPLVGGALALLAATILSAIPAEYIDAWARETLKTVEYLAAFFFAAVAFASDPDETAIWRALETVTGLVCALALSELFTSAPSGMMIGGHVVPRIAGPLEGPNQLAGFLDLSIPLVLARCLTARGDVAAKFVLAFACLADLLTFSRSGVLATVVGCVAVAGLVRPGGFRIRYLVPLLAGAVLIVGALGSLGLLPRYLSFEEIDRQNGLATRSELWKAAWNLWLAHPLLGVGAGNYELELPAAGLIGVRTHANSLYLQALAEGGLVFFAATLWTVVASVRTFWPRRAGAGLLAGIAAGSLALGLHQLFDFLTFFPKVGTYWWLLLGIGLGAPAWPARSRPEVNATIEAEPRANMVVRTAPGAD